MKQNLNYPDRAVRFLIGLLLMWLMYITNEDLLLSMLFGLLGIYFLITSIVAICTVYLFLGINTLKRKKKLH